MAARAATDAGVQQKVEDIFANFDKDRDGVLNRVRASWMHRSSLCKVQSEQEHCSAFSALVHTLRWQTRTGQRLEAHA